MDRGEVVEEGMDRGEVVEEVVDRGEVVEKVVDRGEVVEEVVDGGEVVVVVKRQLVEKVVDGGKVVVVVKRQLVGEVVVTVQERVEVENVLNRVLSHGSWLIQGRTPFLPHFLSVWTLGRHCRCHLVLSLLTTTVS